jgi:hypothetical protein
MTGIGVLNLITTVSFKINLQSLHYLNSIALPCTNGAHITKSYVWPNSIKQALSSEGASRSAKKKNSLPLRNLKVHYRLNRIRHSQTKIRLHLPCLSGVNFNIILRLGSSLSLQISIQKLRADFSSYHAYSRQEILKGS